MNHGLSSAWLAAVLATATFSDRALAEASPFEDTALLSLNVVLLEPITVSESDSAWALPSLDTLTGITRELVSGVSDKEPDELTTEPSHVKAAAARKTGVGVPWDVYPATFALVTIIIVFLYGNRGWSVVASVLTYLAALSTMKLAVKFVFVEYAFTFPKFVTVFHFVSGGVVCFLVLLRRRAQTGVPIAVPTVSEFCFMIVPISMAVALSIGSNNIALGLSSVAFTEVIGSTTCLFTVAMVVLMGMPFERMLLFPTLGVALGCAISTVGELNFSALGMILCFASNAFRSLKVTLQQKLMTGESKDKFDPCTLLCWISVPSTVVMLVGSLVSEGAAPYRRLAGMEPSTLRGLLLAILASCVNAVVLNLAQLFVTKELGAVGGQLVSQAKTVLTVLGGMALFGETVTGLELIGFALVILNVYAFSAMETAFKQREAEGLGK